MSEAKGHSKSALIGVAIICLIIGAGVGYFVKPAEVVEVPGEKVLKYVCPFDETEYSTLAEFKSYMAANFPSIGTLPGEGIRIDFLGVASEEDPFWSVMKKGAEDAGRLTGADVKFWFMTKGDMPSQLAKIESVIATEPDVLILSPPHEEWHPLIEDSVSKGIVTLYSLFDDPESARQGFVGYGLGWEEQSAIVAEYLFEKGYVPTEPFHIVVPVEVPGEPYSVGRSAGWIETLEDLLGVTFTEGPPSPGEYTWELLDAGYEMGMCEERITAYLVGHPETKMVLSVGGMTTERSTVSVTKYLEDIGGEPGDIIVAGFDLLPETITGIMDGYNQGIGYFQQYLSSYYAVIMAFLSAKYDFEPHIIETTGMVIDATNLESALMWFEEFIY